MTDHSGGIHVSGTTVNFGGPVAGRDMTYHAAPQAGPGATGSARPRRSADVAVLTIIDEEIRAVQATLQRMRDYRERRLSYGPLAREAWLPDAENRPIRVAAVQTYTRGTDSAGLAYRELVAEYNPAVVLLVGIAGGVNPKVRVGDVVISDQVIAYDARREAAGHTYRRGQAQAIARPLGDRLNDFMSKTTAEQVRPDGETFHIRRGPIGSGNAVVTDARSEIRRWLAEFNEKVMAVETEAAGVAQSFHESAQQDDSPRGWLTIRGISDTADKKKGHSYHDLAARHAAEVMALILPFLVFDEK
ncbi:hypothetical protein Aph02nite_11750 [Actinoplanes philippinensis]|uniref:Adenosylhomocysteine nucleosidase n=1 Tax=Actinoplanes philippinensis TaxID=35752 RepID=A0A1I1ZXU7_9ACTN|nr:5'-methylthioadenosine/S-adenosylhomocysteine nucleosidase [Actinoplanes philippinensis]GIE75225.1 hypothetical protein Aph02nite_11750 [Actinoplanes philippinensis]SFE36439.1 adenosylhomocysteine nucleosidase [Actinoplanes philippinensis]